ncbi:CSMD1, partial [Symbiodinium natans]
ASSMQEVFALWGKVPPCAVAPLNADVDLILMYSMHFETNPAALAAATELENGFANGTYAWAQCFRSLTIHQANLTSYEDIYDARGYEVRRDWVNGPNLVFRAVLKNFMDGTFGNYSHFYYMEFDAVPVREMWMDQFVTEALFYPEAAIRGSHFRGDTWDTFLTSMPVELLYHINGNAIYNVRHPWLQFLATKLDE